MSTLSLKVVNAGGTFKIDFAVHPVHFIAMTALSCDDRLPVGLANRIDDEDLRGQVSWTRLWHSLDSILEVDDA